jgi:hypothetical protein
MPRLGKYWFLCSLWGFSAAASFEPLRVHDLQQSLKGPCTLVHPWATWCTRCLEDLPTFLSETSQWQGIKTLVVDISTPLMRSEFSSQWSVIQKANTHFLPEGFSLEKFKKVLSPSWDGSLPYSVLFIRSRRRKEWKGQVPVDALAQQVKSLCR